MGRYSVPLAPQLADFAMITVGQRVLDVGCGPGALTAELVRRLGPDAVSAVDPSEPFVAAARQRHPGVSVQRAAAEQLPFGDRTYDAALAQLVVHFMADPVRGLREMARVTRKDGVVAACVWDHAGGQGPLSVFWEAALELDRDVEDESQLAGAREGHLAQLFRDAGLHGVEEGVLSVEVELGRVRARPSPHGRLAGDRRVAAEPRLDRSLTAGQPRELALQLTRPYRRQQRVDHRQVAAERRRLDVPFEARERGEHRTDGGRGRLHAHLQHR